MAHLPELLVPGIRLHPAGRKQERSGEAGPEYFCRLFKKYTGQTFLTYVNQIRLQYFHSDLLQTDESITYLMNKNGITNYKVFLRSFKEAYGMPPGQLRKKQREVRDAGAISAWSASSSGNDSKTETERMSKPRTPDN